VPQFVAISFDDNFGEAQAGAIGGVSAIVAHMNGKKNPDDSPALVTFFHTSIYMVDGAKTVLGGKQGEDIQGRNRAAWTAAFQAGHEVADHTVNHFNGGIVPLDPDDCCRARDYDVAAWKAEIGGCRDHLTDAADGLGVGADQVVGFRTPFLGYNDRLFSALVELGFLYDSTLPNCFADDEDGTNCSWPYTLHEGSPDIDVARKKFPAFAEVTHHPGLWEVPPTTLIVPENLRAKIAARAPLPYPSAYEASSGKITGLDYTLLIDAGLTGAEMAAVLKHNLDLHLAGNRAPLVFIAHSHLYTFTSADDNPDTPSAEVRAERWAGLVDYIAYAQSKKEVRLVRERDIVAWIQQTAGIL
jgi:hypothetical protein